ncbi:MAG: acyltransferase, partial [Bacteroidia bacterium]|nr:acyltransferase [Bacteroidia bacterium]
MTKPFAQNNAYDSLRGISNIVVVLVHVEYIRSFFGYVNHYANPAVYHVGRICVSGFFVLSGFLITRNLLKIKNEPESLGRKFGVYYLKRILRIFPLYYTLIFLSMFVLPHIHALRYNIPPGVIDARTVLPQVSHYYYFLFPQVPLAHRIVLPFAEPTWSIGIEELFYVVMPILLFALPVKKNWLLVAAA